MLHYLRGVNYRKFDSKRNGLMAIEQYQAVIWRRRLSTGRVVEAMS
ncbi:hypothetical protein EDC52_1104 [Biostraticola tofi]|uniref:Uncharacterized protein n=1 Tax=Biostraticola tofi TaxID=466109 RepID=A0A4R3YLD1_9GAMM|nr:hypothetical protein EDC52_1104 [Biostraticola tofi]